jgi:putative peptide zinc metalloprotease protein
VATQLPQFRQDLEVIPRLVEGEGLRYILNDPQTGKIFGFREEEYFICRQLDGQTPLPAIQDAFFQHFHVPMELEQLEAFVRHLASLELLEYTLAPEEIPWHFPVYYKKRTLGNPDRVLQGLSTLFSWCFSRVFVICLGLLVLMGIMLQVKYFSFYRDEAVRTLWKPGPFVLETLLGLFIVNMMGEFGKALALKHWGGNVPEVCMGLAYRLIPTFHFDISDLWMEKKTVQLKILSAGLAGQLLLWSVAMLGWRISVPWSNVHTFWVIFTVSAQFFFLINLIPLVPRDGYFLLAAWLEIPDLFYRARGLVEAWVFRRPLPEPLTPRERLGFKVFGVLSIVFLVAFWMLLLGIIGYCLIWYWKLKGLGACLFLLILGLRYGDAMKQLARRLFSPRGFLLNQEGFIKNRLLFWLGLIVILIIIFLIPYPFEAGGNFKILPINQLSVRAVVSGQIEKVLVKDGQWVEKGQILALLLDKDQKARLDSAKESLAAGQEKLNWMRIGPKPEEVAKAAQEVKLVAKALHYSTIEADRYIKMFREKSVSEEEYMNKLRARDEDRERLALTQKNLALVKVPFRPEEIKAQEAEVRRLEAVLALAEKDLQLTKLLSPIAGRMITAYPLQKVGQYLDVGDLLGVIENAQITIAEIEVPENDITQVKVGARVKLKTWALPTKTFTGKVTQIAPVGHDQKRHRVERVLTEREFRTMQVIPESDTVIRVLSEFPNTDGLLRTDMSGYAKIRGKWMPLGVAFTRWLMRLLLVEIWSWIP